MVRALKSARPDLTVVKAIHVRGSDSVERPLIGAYERSGVDVFLFDSLTADGRVGSTAHQLDPQVVADLAELISRPFLLAGGLTMENAVRFRQLAGHPRFRGIDVDSGARGPDGRICPERVAAIGRSWTAMEAAAR
jgi:phosphoribosylanthranilate isomerase